jgi:hypothetical protein
MPLAWQAVACSCLTASHPFYLEGERLSDRKKDYRMILTVPIIFNLTPTLSK